MLGLSQGYPRGVSALVARHETHPDKSAPEHLWGWEELLPGVWDTGVSQWAAEDLGNPSQLYRCVGWSAPPKGCEAVALRAQMSRCMQLVRLGPRGSCWAERVPEPSCWRDGYRCVYLCILTSGALHWSAREVRRMRLSVLCECSLRLSLLPVVPAVCVCI